MRRHLTLNRCAPASRPAAAAKLHTLASQQIRDISPIPIALLLQVNRLALPAAHTLAASARHMMHQRRMWGYIAIRYLRPDLSARISGASAGNGRHCVSKEGFSSAGRNET
jgi:hypothetical protein